jgi:hypothetical protein
MDERRFVSILAIAVIVYSIWRSQDDQAVPNMSSSSFAAETTTAELPEGYAIMPVQDTAILLHSQTGQTWRLSESLDAWIPLERLSSADR